MKEIPILMRAESVLGTLAYRKCQTRRLVKPQPDGAWKIVNDPFVGWAQKNAGDPPAIIPIKCPYGKPGDRLWVRETWGVAGALLIDPCMNYRADGQQLPIIHNHPKNSLMVDNLMKLTTGHKGWRANIHMPRWACRILLTVTEIRIERLNDISEADCYSEGACWHGIEGGQPNDYKGKPIGLLEPWRVYARWWDEINGRTEHTWEANPLVWVINYQVHEIKDTNLQ